MKYIKKFEESINWNEVLYKVTWNNLDFDKIKLAIENGANPDYGETLSWALRCQKYNIVKYMVEHGANINFQDDDCKWTPIMLCFADEEVRVDIAKFLIDHDADLTIGNFQDTNALDILSHTKLQNASFGYPNVAKKEQKKMDEIFAYYMQHLAEKTPEDSPKYKEYLTADQKIKFAPYLDAEKFNI